MATSGVYYEVKRGDVYYIRFDKGWGSEMAAGRPVVIVSNDAINKSIPIFTCVYMTTNSKSMDGTAIPLTTPKKKSWALCNQVYSYDEARLTEYMCTLSSAEMDAIDAGLALSLNLPLNDPTEKERHRSEIADLVGKHESELAELKAAHEKELEAVRNEVTDKLVDYELYKRMYDSAMDRLASVISGRELNNRCRALEQSPAVATVVEESTSVAEPVVAEPAPVVEETPALVDINRCTLGDLAELGFSMATAKMIQAARPYMDIDDLRGVPGVTRIAYQLVEKKITVGDTSEFVKPKPAKKKKEKPAAETPKVEEAKHTESVKLNVNTAKSRELVSYVGMAQYLAYRVANYRKTHGEFKSLEELLNVPQFSPALFERFKDRLTV